MAFFARPACYSGPQTSFTPLFRLFDDFEKFSQEVQGHSARHHQRQARTFSPKFDVRETEHAYELHGELPGIERDNLHIEFTEPQTIAIRGHVDRSQIAGTPTTTAAIKDTTSVNNSAINDTEWESVPGEKEATHPHQATVSDEEIETAKENGASAEKPIKGVEKQPEEPRKPADKYWVSERSIGDFSRIFNFPGRIEQNGVTAKLNNGILTVSVPKAKKHEALRINIA